MHKIKITTFGCSANIHESEVMAGLLKKAGFKLINYEKNSDLIIANICTVKGNTKALREIKKIKNKLKHKKLIVAGCISEDIYPEIKEIAPEASLINTHNIDQIVKAVNEALKGKTIEILKKKDIIKLCLPKIRKNKIISIVPICSGCNSACSYCSVRLLKGKLFSYPQNLILEEIKNSLREGCKEIWITSQNNAAYEYDLVNLLQKIIELKGDFKVRIGMMNPNNVRKILKPLIKIYKNEKIFKFLHIPVQSGNNEILKAMNRLYKVKDFEEIMKEFRKQIPNLTVSTDIIVGFPGETEKQFNDSLNLIKEIKPDVLNISRFISRPGTVAAKLKNQISGGEIKNRSRKLTKEFDKIALAKNKKWIGWQGEILIDEKGKENSFIGRNFAYKPVIVKRKHDIGEIANVKIRNATSYDLRA